MSAPTRSRSRWLALPLFGLLTGCGDGLAAELAGELEPTVERTDLVSEAVALGAHELAQAPGQGLREATPEEVRELLRRAVRRVRPTALALERKNRELREAGLPPLESSLVAPIGEDTEVADASGGAATTEVTGGAALAAAVDNSLLPAFPPIGNQGSEGSCVGWALTYYNASHETCLVRGCDNKASSTHRFSPRWTYNMVNGGADNGSSFSQHVNILVKHGAPSLALLPYVAGDYRRWDLDPAHWRAAIGFRTNPSQTVSGMNTDSGMAAAKQVLANGHVLAFGTYITSWAYSTVKSGPFAGQRAVTHMTGTVGGHGMTLVGYDDSLWVDVNANGVTDPGELGAFKVANSWGTSWGNAGFIWVAYDALRTTSAVAGGPTTRVPLMNNGGNTAFYLPARTAYTPRLLAEFTLSTASRNQLSVLLGASASTATSPATSWVPAMVRNQGGAYAFDGTTTAVDGTFVMDLSELASTTGAAQNFYLTVADSAAGAPATLKGFTLVDVASGARRTLAEGLPRSVDGSSAVVALGYSLSDGNSPPVARLGSALAVSGESALGTFDGSASSDPDGVIAAYSWSFGDGSAPESGPQASHLYTRAGRFTVTLTVTDDRGATGTASVAVDVPDLTPPTAPGGLTASLAKGGKRTATVKLAWSAAADNVGVATYVVHRDGVRLGTTSGTGFSDTTTVAGRSYVYTVRAQDAAGNLSPDSNAATLTR